MRWFVKPLDGDFGKRPITEITPQELLHELRKHERRGRLDTTNLLRAFASRVFRYGVATARAVLQALGGEPPMGLSGEPPMGLSGEPPVAVSGEPAESGAAATLIDNDRCTGS